MPRLLAAEIAAVAAHRLDDVAVADRACGSAAMPWLCRKRSKPRLDMTVATTPPRASWPARCHRSRDQRHQLIAVEQSAVFVGDHQPVGVAVERDADIGALRTTSRCIAMGAMAPQSRLMLSPSGFTPSGMTSAPSSHNTRRGDLVGGAIGAIDHDLEPVEAQPARKAVLDEFDIAAAGIVEPLGAAELLRPARAREQVSADLRLDGGLDLVRQLVAVRAEELDAVVLERIVRGRDHDAEIGAQASASAWRSRASATGRPARRPSPWR